MALFELKDGRLGAASPGRPAGSELRAQVLDAVRSQLGQVLRRPLLPVVWTSVEDGHSLTAVDPAGQVITIEVLNTLDAAALVAALSRQAETSAMGRGALAAVYPAGAQAFREDWNEFREAVPSRVEPGPQLIVLAAELASDVRLSATFLGGSVEVHVVDVRVTELSGQGESVLVGVELLRVDPFAASPTTLAARAPRRALGARSSQTESRAAGRAASRTAPAPRPAARQERVAPEPAPAAEPTPAPVAQPVPTASQRPAPADRPVMTERPVAAPGRRTSPEAPWMAASAPAAQSGSRTGTSAPEDLPSTPPRRDSWSSSSASPSSTYRLPDEAFDVSLNTGSHRSLAPILGAQPTISAADAPAALAALARTLSTPATLRWYSMRRGIDHTAILTRDGVITLADGRSFTDPSLAASAAQRTQDVDGWRVWRVGERGATLAELLD